MLDKKRQTNLIRSSLKISTIEGSWWAVMYGMVEAYFSAFFEILRYSSFEISILTTFPLFIGACVQNLAYKFYHFFQSRKILLVALKFLQSLLIPTIYLVGIKLDNFFIFLIFISAYFAIALSQQSPWTSWMGYLVPSRLRGRYFGHRSQIIRISMLVSSLFAGVILNAFENNDPILGFGIIFIIGVIANFGSAYYLFSQYEPSYHSFEEKDEKIDLRDMKFEIIKKYISYDSFSELSFSISGPLMMVYWIRELNFNYLEIAILINASQLIGLFSMRYWGRKIDKIGTYPVIRFNSMWICLFPILWIIIYYSHDHLRLPLSLILASLASLMFSGRALAMDNRLYEHMNGKSMIKLTSKRVFYRGTAIFIGGFIGGLVSGINYSIDIYLFEIIKTGFHVVLFISFIIRSIIWIKFLRKVKGQV